MEQIKSSFAKYASLVGKDGYAIYNSDDGNVLDALKTFEGNRISFAVNDKSATVRAEKIEKNLCGYSFDIIYEKSKLCHVDLRVSGYHNIYNALAAASACVLCGLTGEEIARRLASFCGACRRMEYKGSVGGADVYDDYGHHPTEIAATLRGAKEITEGRLFCVYQPHTYSRTAALFEEFARSFEACDRVIFVDIYAAREKNTFGVSSSALAERIGERASYANDFKAAADALALELRVGDVAVVMGAGDIYKVFDYLPFTEE